MSHAFEVKPLVGGKFLIKGTDEDGNEGRTALFSPSWAAYLHSRKQAAAQEGFDILVRAFFKPLTDAADKLKEDQPKDWGTVTVIEGAPGVIGQGIALDEDGKLLNILDQERGDLLVWIDDHTLGAIEE